MSENDWYENLCRTGQILWRKHELMRDEFQNVNSMDCYRYENHIKHCPTCQKALASLNEVKAETNKQTQKITTGRVKNNIWGPDDEYLSVEVQVDSVDFKKGDDVKVTVEKLQSSRTIIKGMDREITELELKIHGEVKDFEKRTGKTVNNISICGDPDTIVVWID